MQKDKVSFVSELNLGGYYKITESLSLFGGYNVMWLDVARAADQLDFTFQADSCQFVATRQQLMHGANAGLSWNY
jgi:hypothetical protein